jgi:hypothetical protein
MRYYSIKIDNAPTAFKAVNGASIAGAQWDSWVNNKNDPNAQQIEFQFNVKQWMAPRAGQSGCWLTIHGIPFEQIKQSADLFGKHITIYGGMKPGLPLATEQSKKSKHFLLTGKVMQCFGNWIYNDTTLTLIIGVDTSQTVEVDPKSDVPVAAQAGMGGGGGVAGQHGNIFSYKSRTSSGPRSIASRGMAVAPTGLSGGIGGIIGTISALLTTGTEQIGNEFISLLSAGGNVSKPLNVIHNMKPNQLLSDAIRETLQRAFPNAKLDINISPNLKLAYQDAGMYQSLQQYAGYIKQLSHSILGGGGPGGYAGVHIVSDGSSIKVLDYTNGGSGQQGGSNATTGSGGSTANTGNTGGKTSPLFEGEVYTPTKPDQFIVQVKPTTLVAIDFTDLIGQPTWIESQTISIKTVMRTDIDVGYHVTLPPNVLITTNIGAVTPGSIQPKMGALTFEGMQCTIIDILHTGDFRNPDGAAWCTTFKATVPPPTNSNADNVTKTSAITAQSNNDMNPTVDVPPSSPAARAGALVGAGALPQSQITRTVRWYGR